MKTIERFPIYMIGFQKIEIHWSITKPMLK